MIKNLGIRIKKWYLAKSGIKDEHDKEFRVVKTAKFDEILGSFEYHYSLERRQNFVWQSIKDGFKSYEDAVKYHSLLQEYMKLSKTEYLPINKSNA